MIHPEILDENSAVHLIANKTFVDKYGIERKAGEEYLITNLMSTYHIIDIYEELYKKVKRTILDAL